jgi:cell division septum initiation protein DivIVA
VLELIERLDALLAQARVVPLTDQVRVERDSVYELLDEIRAVIPEEVRQARWIVKEREDMLAEARRECDRLLSEAREQAARECSEQRVIVMAERQAEEILQQARRKAHELQADLDEWADAIFSTLELNLEKFCGAVRRGRERLLERSSKESPLKTAPPAGVGDHAA